MKSDFRIIFKHNQVIVYLNKKIFLEQPYIQNKRYTFLYVMHIMHKYGFQFSENNIK